MTRSRRMFSTHARAALCVALLAGSLPLVSFQTAAAAPPPDADSVRRGVERITEWLDSPSYGDAVTWDEHVVLTYRAAQGRDPSALELQVLRGLRDEIHLPRSAALAIALRGEATELAWERVRTLRAARRDFRSSLRTRETAARLLTIPRDEALRPLRRGDRASTATATAPTATAPASVAAAPPVHYSVYYGYLHAHSGLSDGKGKPEDAYVYARDVAKLDFFGLTDHGELLRIWPWENKWNQLKNAAAKHYAPGRFATLWGFEWSSPVFGHINIINSRDFTDAVTTLELPALYDWLRARPQAFGRFNHPGRVDDLLLEFLHLAPYPAVRRQMVGIETFNKGDGFGEIHYDCEWALCAGTYLDHGNLQGWMLGALGGQDNHSRDWGTDGEYRVGVLAAELTREAIVDAYFQRRFFATEDRDLALDFRAAGQPMGSTLPTATPRRFAITACDEGGDLFTEARLYRDGQPIAVAPLPGSCTTAELTDPSATGTAYYYAIVRQSDDNDRDGRGDEAISSPIWFAD
jgi:hypothetical protein